MRIPRFTADRSLTSAAPHRATGPADEPLAEAAQPSWYCCVMRPSPDAPVVGCRGHNAWYPFAWAGCVGEAAVNQLSATLVEGRCSDRPECRGKVL
jgi:hypothetical protein